MEPIILASSSPRRQEILKLLNIPFQVIIPNTDETITQGFSPEEASELIARQKISEIIHSKPMGQEIPWILSADTIILFNGKLYGKPQSHEEAFNFLKEFQGKSHEVLTSIVLYNGKTKETVSKTCRTKVTFAKMSDEEIQWYLDAGGQNWFNKGITRLCYFEPAETVYCGYRERNIARDAESMSG